MHPQRLDNHTIDEFLHDICFDSDTEFEYVSAYFHSTEQGFPIGMHQHAFYEMNIIVDGTGYHYLGSQCLEAKKGSVYVIPPHVRHGYYTNDENFKIFHLLLNSVFIERYKEELNALPGYSILFEIEPFLRSESGEAFFLKLEQASLSELMILIDLLVSSENDKYSGCSILKISKALLLIGLLSRMIYKSQIQIKNKYKAKNNYSSLIVNTLEYMHSNYYKKIQVEDLAQVAKMSRSTFLRHFKSICKCTPNDYLTEYRIKKACDMLLSCSRTITEISQDCGFFDCSHFIKVFATAKGLPPSEFRKHNQG